MITFSAIGDSQSNFLSIGGTPPPQRWLSLLPQLYAAARGVSAQGRGFGISGDTSLQNLARIDGMLQWEIPNIGCLYIGVNDPGNSISQASTQANIQAMIKALKFGACGCGDGGPITGPSGVVGAGQGGPAYVAGQANLPPSGTFGARFVVLSDTDSSGGVSPTVSGAGGSAQTVWEYRNPLAGNLGWGRVATVATVPDHVQQIVVVSTNYLNFTTGGDTPSTPYASYATVRAAQQAAVTAENVLVNGVASVVYADLYNYQRNRIVAQTDPNFSSDTSIVPSVAYSQPLSWHYTQNNQHHNVYGDWLVAQAAFAALPAQW